MLIFNACDGNYNIIHIVMGPQTQFQLDMTGRLKIDLQRVIANFENSLPVKMVMTRTENEKRTVQMLSSLNGQLPFPPTFFEDEEQQELTDDAEEERTMYEESPLGQYAKELVCPGCKEHGVYLKKDMPPYCADCLKIELGLGNIDTELKEDQKK
jgi:hypothetical protein